MNSERKAGNVCGHVGWHCWYATLRILFGNNRSEKREVEYVGKFNNNYINFDNSNNVKIMLIFGNSYQQYHMISDDLSLPNS